MEKYSSTSSVLNLISFGEELVLGPLVGQRTIANAKDIFQSGIGNDFINWGLDKPGIATPKIFPQVHEIASDADLLGIFTALPGTREQKWLSQDQVIEFCDKYANWLRPDGHQTLFLCKKDETRLINGNKLADNLIVVKIRVLSDGLFVNVLKPEDYLFWQGEYRHRVVSPGLLAV